MDKRSLFFVICLSITLFLVNNYFSQQDLERRRQWAEYEKQLAEYKQRQMESELQDRVAKIEALPLAEYRAGEQTRIGVLLDGNLLTISQSGDDASDVTVTEPDGRAASYARQTVEAVPGSVVLYRKAGAAVLSAGALPMDRPTEVQIVSFYLDENAPQIEQGVAMYERGQLRTPYGAPQHNGLVLVETPGGYIPAGIYLAQEKSILALDKAPSLENLVLVEAVAIEEDLKDTAEKFYVLENDFQQLVFSSKGGALVEINLPFLSDSNTHSVVRSIEPDASIAEESPANAQFPLFAYSNPAGATVESKKGGYYPLLRRSLIQDETSVFRAAPKFYALNVVSDYPEVAELPYRVVEYTATKIVFEATQPHRRITKTFTIEPDAKGAPYVFNCRVKVDGDSRGLWLTTGVPEVEWISGGPAPTLKYRITRNDVTDVEKLDLPKETVNTSSLDPDWFCNSNGFFGVILDPLSPMDAGYRADKVPGTALPSRLIQVDRQFDRYKAKDLPGYQCMLPLRRTGGEMEFRVYAGPFADQTLRIVDAALTDAQTGAGPDYRSSQTFHGYFAFISRPFAKFLFVLMTTFYNLSGSWALSIVLLTVALRVILYPLNAWSMRKMRVAQKLKPLLDDIDAKYKKDPQKAQMEKFNLLREHKANPLAGCFGLLIQMPFLIGMFDLLKSTFELRGAPFIPGWIDNLTAPDVLFTWGFALPVIGNQLHVLPLLTGAMMYLQSKLSTTLPADKSEWTDAHRQQAMMGPMMAGMFALFFYNFPSGLNIYWLSSTALGILQQMWLNRQIDSNPLEPGKPQAGPKGKKKLRSPA